MFEYTYQNHFKFGYDDNEWYCNRSSPLQKFVTSYGRATSDLKSWREANQLAARQIKMSTDLPIWVLYSGGIDSEICLKSFLDEGINVEVAIMRFKNGLNEHDINYAFKFCHQYNLQYSIFDIDILEFWNSSEYLQIVDLCHCVSPQLAACLWLADQVEGLPIIAQGDPYLKKSIPKDYIPGVSPYLPSDWYYNESDRLCSLFRFFILKNKPAVPAFFQYLPEQILSFLKYNNYLKKLINNEIVGKLGTRTSKALMYREDYPELEFRPKYHGFEQLEEVHAHHRAELAKRFPLADTDFSIKYEDLILALTPDGEGA